MRTTHITQSFFMYLFFYVPLLHYPAFVVKEETFH